MEEIERGGDGGQDQDQGRGQGQGVVNLIEEKMRELIVDAADLALRRYTRQIRKGRIDNSELQRLRKMERKLYALCFMLYGSIRHTRLPYGTEEQYKQLKSNKKG